MFKKSLLGAVAALVLASGSAFAADQIKLYQVASGTLTLDKSGLTAGVDVGKMFTVPVAMYIIDHPRGLIVYDTGVSAEAIGDGCNGYFGKGLCDSVSPKQTRDDIIDRQLQKFGYKPEDVKYVILSHLHYDHAGNMSLFPKATHILQKDELRFGWWPDKFYSSAYILKDIEKTRDFKFLELTGDYDLFGDGSVVILDTKGHTVGHQSLKVRLPKTGTVILTGDAIYTTENENGVPPGLTISMKDSFASTDRLKRLRDAEAGQLWFSHDPAQYATHAHDKAFE
jgi:N-acyl homoserine lactone hydrolase